MFALRSGRAAISIDPPERDGSKTTPRHYPLLWRNAETWLLGAGAGRASPGSEGR